MSNELRRPILYRGEVYVSPIVKKVSGSPKEPKVSYDIARDTVLEDIKRTREVLNEMPASTRLPNEVVLCLKMQPEFSAKSYYPDSLFDLNTTKFGIKDVGSRAWNDIIAADLDQDGTDSTLQYGKMFFIRSTEVGLNNLEKQLHKSESELTQKFTYDIRRIFSLDILSPAEQILGFSEEWQGGRMEAVLHPFALDKEAAVLHFFDLLEGVGVDSSKIKYKQYGHGVTFVSFVGDRSVISAVAGYNPLRTVHPLEMRVLPNVNRGTPLSGGPLPPDFKVKSPIVIGVIDGGAMPGHPYLDSYVEIEDSVAGTPYSHYTDHGMQVCGAVLYGPLNKFLSKEKLPEPLVSVKSFRVLSEETIDPDLYDVIDAIEEIVPANEGISVYNISLGPRGAIQDDCISRFTFACDLLSNEYGVLFCAAVGNDGRLDDGYNRIQSPADMVNGLGVGAYTKKNGLVERSPYSCVGPGREGSKMKPDVSAFGGCDNHPIHLVAPTLGERIWSQGTSFASPVVAGVAGQLIGENPTAVDALVARALLIHSARNNSIDGFTVNLGHGALPEDPDQIITCSDKSYTLIYRGEIEPGKYAEYSIPWVDNITRGKVKFKWTTAVLTDIDELSPYDYTTSSIETSFYPNNDRFVFTKGTKTRRLSVETDREEIEKLFNDGWKQSTFPQSDSSKSTYRTEEELRADFKWDSVESRYITKQASGVRNPLFHVHALGRGSRVANGKVKFAIILTVEAPGATVDLYSRVLNRFSALVPLSMTVRASASARAGS